MAKNLVDEFVRELGEDATREFMDACGGMRIYIPQKIGGEGPISKLSPETAAKVVQAFGNENIEIPRNRFAGQARTKRIVELLDEGRTLNQIAAAVRCSERWVRRVKAKRGQERR